MIWVQGQIFSDDGLVINASDRTFEHGLGLFETVRARQGRAPLLEAHKARMLRSAEDLRIPIDPAHFPDDAAVRQLLETEGIERDQMLRITASGGSYPSGSTVWMRSWSMSKGGRTPQPGSLRVALDTWAVGHHDPLARHKTLNFWARRIAHQSAVQRGFDETLGLLNRNLYCEGGWSNLFVVLGEQLLTPSLQAPIVPGIMRRLVLDLAKDVPMAAREIRGISKVQLAEAGEVFLTNAVRGIMPVSVAEGSDARHEWPAPGPWTVRLQAALADHLNREPHP